MSLQRSTLTFAIALFCAAGVMAQSGPTTAMQVVTAGAAPLPGRGATMAIRTEFADATPVKGSPFCATVVNEHTQTFADGNRIHTAENSALCRDSEGRTRRESQLNLLGAVPQGAAPKIITITDPVAGVRYVLDGNSKTARKMPLSGPPFPPGDLPKGGSNVMFYTRTGGLDGPPPGGPGQAIFINKLEAEGKVTPNGAAEAAPNSESLGDQTINGLHAAGKRITTTIPAGQMGNEQPINVVSEDWYSPELKTMVKTKHCDPWAGELTTQLTNVTTAEPDTSLFVVPGDYKVVNDSSEPFLIKVKPLEPPAQ